MTSDLTQNFLGKILVVDDNSANIRLLYNLLSESGYHVLVARDGERAIQVVETANPDLILLDVMMPGIDGFDTCSRLKENPLTSDIPVIFMTALADTIDKIKGLNLGAVDYITKPFQLEEVLAHVKVHLKLRNLTKLLQEQNSLLQQEIQERKLVQEALQESEQKYRFLVETSQDIIFFCDAQGRFSFVNQAVKKIHGYEPEEMIGRPFTDFVPLEYVTKYQEVFYRILVGEPCFQYETIHIAKDNRRINLLFNVIVVRDAQGNVLGVMGTASDITERKQAEDALRQSEAKLKAAKEAADKANQAKSEFLSKMSHELRTPLNAILGFTQVLARDYTLTTQQKEHLGIISRAGEHLLTLINDVLEMSKIEAGKIELYENSFDLFHLLNSLNEMFYLKAKSKGLQLIFEQSPHLPQYIKTDESKLRQVLINLLGNAIKFTEKGGVILRVFNDDRKQQIKLLFEIEDTGFGISNEELKILFNPFIQTSTGKNSQSGTGLGLPISRQFVQLMGGDIVVNSRLGESSIFKFDINIKLAEPIEVTTPKLSPKVIGLEPNQSAYRILVVDDVWESRLLLIHLLSSLGFEVCQAANGQEAIAISQKWHPHLIWMDMQMPVVNGYEATKQIKAQAQEIIPVIIALTASAFDDNRTEVLAAGCDDFVSKPFREELLFAKIAEYLGVRYLYEEPLLAKNPKSSQSEKLSVGELTPEDLAVMPKEWIVKLYQAASALDEDLVSDLVKPIYESHPHLTNYITKLAQDLRFDKIIDLIPKSSLMN